MQCGRRGKFRSDLRSDGEQGAYLPPQMISDARVWDAHCGVRGTRGKQVVHVDLAESAGTQ